MASRKRHVVVLKCSFHLSEVDRESVNVNLFY